LVMKIFPPNFIWGTSTSAHQIEGGNVNDWSQWELRNADRLAKEAPGKFENVVPRWDLIKAAATDPQNYISGKATDHYHLFREDIALMRSLNIKAFRFSIEWARIEPERGKFDQQAIEHYAEVLGVLKESGIEPFVTLWHRTNPLWIAEIGGWANPEIVRHFGNYVEKLTEVYGDKIKFWMTLNEPILSLVGGYLGGVYPPGKKNIFAALKVFKHSVAAHNFSSEIIHKNVAGAQVGIPHAAVYAEAYKNRWYNRALVSLVHYFADWKYLKAIERHTDFIGIQYYQRALLNINILGKGAASQSGGLIQQIKGAGPESDMGWEFSPEGLYRFIKEAQQRFPKIPLYISENGIADAEDQFRAGFIKEHLRAAHRAISEGVDLRGYFYWSLLDNLEWDKGFWPRFGLLEVDYKNFKRTVRDSARIYSEIIKNNGLE